MKTTVTTLFIAFVVKVILERLLRPSFNVKA